MSSQSDVEVLTNTNETQPLLTNRVKSRTNSREERDGQLHDVLQGTVDTTIEQSSSSSYTSCPVRQETIVAVIVVGNDC